MRLITKFTLISAGLALPLAACSANNESGTDVAKDEVPATSKAPVTARSEAPTPAISEQKAREIAAAASNGELSEADYEEEDGAWRWSFDVKEGGKIHEIGVDATTGKIVEDKYETSEEEAHEED